MKSDNEKVFYASLGEYADVIDPHPSHRAPEEVADGYPFLGIGDIDYFGTAAFDKVRHVDVSVIEDHEKSYIIDDKTIGYAKMGNTIGKIVSFPDRSKHRYAISPALSIINPKPNINPWYLRAVVESYEFWGHVNGKITGSTRPSIGIQQLRNVSIPIFPNEIQNIIGEIWKVIYDKISLNMKINENLELQAQAIFKSWFLDFEPFGGVMPEDWRTGSLSEICGYSKDKVNIEDLTLDTYYSTENMQPNRQGAIQATALPTIKQTIACKKGDVLISNIRPYFKKIIYCFADCGCSTDVLCFVPNKSEYSAFLYCALYSDKFFDYMVAGSKGTKMPRGDKQQIMMYPICIPSTEYVEQFSKIVAPMLETVYTNRLEANDLAILRDTLLPKLMKGEIDVSEVKI
ncbi:MAG: restriction endonuclease subunit S [Ruminococcus callidus]|uniref:restriction endonuclease subunit S n=1 Tax=Ruminococcus callidus TaxID=40519 RepID=UPI002E785C99|nr:restriction endonuclease subunit S [Ruminococcus callidus]MEE0506395.1 restriction endonuclease subunit S [Ruminococcus callidus]